MSETAVLAIGGLACGCLAGMAAQYGRLCTFAAIEDAVMAGDFRRARAWVLAIVVAVALTQALAAGGLLDLGAVPYGGPALSIGGALIGGLLFGFGMSQVGTCAFGLLVRAGAGDLRCIVNLLLVGVAAFAATGGALSGARTYLSGMLVVDLQPAGGATLSGISRALGGDFLALLMATALIAVGLTWVLACERVARKPRLISASIGIGFAVAGGWFVTGVLVDKFAAARVESLTFVAPIGRLLLLVMGESLAGATFAVMTVMGVLVGSLIVAAARRETRWEAFDDPREMRRHILGSICMGFGGVLAQGCTIGQGMAAASTLALSAPIALLGMVIGARIGLAWLIEGAPALFHRSTLPSLRKLQRFGRN